MKFKTLILSALAVLFIAGQAFALPNLYVNGSATAETPVGGPNTSLSYYAIGGYEQVRFTLLYEMTPSANVNSLFAHDAGDFNNYFTIFDDDDAVGATNTIVYNFGQFYTHSLLNDLNDNGIFDAANDEVWLNTNLSWTLPASSDYQWFRVYKTGVYGYADFFFGDGGGDLSFSGKYDELWFIDDDHVTYPNYDHNDMVVGVTIVPEPTTLLLLGLGLAGAGIIRRRRN